MMLPILPALIALLADPSAAALATASASYWCPEPAPSVAVGIPSIAAFQEESAPRFSYDYLEAELALGSAAGFNLAGSYGFGEGLYGTGRLQYLTDEESGVDVDLLAFSVGATYVMEMQEGFDLLATGELEYGRVEASAGPFSASDSEIGILLRGGARYAFDPQLEAFGGLSLRTIFDADFVLDGGVRYQYSDSLALQASLDLGDETLFSLGVRYSL